MTEPKISMMRQLYDLGNQIKWFFFGRADERAQNDSATNYEKVKRTFIYLVIAVDLIVVIFLTQCPCLDCGVSNSIASFLITSSAVLVAGILIGFLFGIPKKQKAVADTTTASSQSSQVNRSLSYYDDNTNLEEISDWLTKIIIGLSLIEFQQIRDEAIETSQNIAKIFICMPPEIGYVIGFSTLIFFSGTGLTFGYLWARIKLVLLLTDNRNKQSKLELDFMNSTNRKTIDQANSDAAHGATKTDGEGFKIKVQKENADRPVTVPDDLQKDRWGGKSERDGFALSAKVTKGILGLFDLELEVKGNSTQAGEVSQVAFFLHDTFPKEVVYVKMVNNVAKLNLTAYEAFTLGALLYVGNKAVELELDLNTIPGYPSGFYYKE